MAFRTFIVIGILFLIQSCAQVSSLTGGDKDIIAPKPISEKLNPKNGSTNFINSEIKIPFSEFIKLNSPNETLIMIPPHAKPTARIDRKTVYINWTDTLRPNTTYSLYLNGTIKDITEGNDSLMQIVFSTGDSIDSLAYQVKVIDAFTNAPIKNCLVGLYEGKTDSIRPTYFVKTSDTGIAKFSYLKEGKYTILAFEDKNKDMLLQVDENLAFTDKYVDLSPELMDSNSILTDSVPLRLFSPKLKPRIRSLVYKAPGMFLVGSTASLKNASFKVNNEPLTADKYTFLSEDSLCFFYAMKDSSSLEFISSSEIFIDTISVRLTKKEKDGKLAISSNLTESFLYPSDTLTLTATDFVTNIDSSNFILTNKDDSTIIKIKKIVYNKNKLFLFFDRNKITNAELKISLNAVISSTSALRDTFKLKIQFKEDKDLGIINLDASEYSQPIVVEALSGGKVIRSIPLDEIKTVKIDNLLPSDYTFRVILDANKNGKWDSGNRSTNTFPEILHTFSEVTKVRANWEMDLKLTKQD